MSPRRPDLPPLARSELRADPFAQFDVWFERALAEAPLAEAMTLATVDLAGHPDARMVLLKGFGPGGFRFFTSYESAKGGQLGGMPYAALVVYWRELDRQVRARGPVERLSAEDSDAYFATRSRDSQLGAWASPQSRPIHSRGELDGLLDEARERFGDGEVARPPHWGGYVLRPETVEFWQGQVARLHDRFRYVRREDGWQIERLAP
ncbi:MAG TPA: pyridoxamine 5'-phosphate oxidase [Solirubrobacterales bacterium]